MHATVATCIAMVLHGNARLRGARPDDVHGRACPWCRGAGFVFASAAESAGASATPIAGDADDWFDHLRDRGTRRILLAHDHRPFDLSADEAGQWRLVTQGRGGCDGWSRRAWPAEEGWGVSWLRYPDVVLPRAPPGIVTARRSLLASLREIARFAGVVAPPVAAAHFDAVADALEAGATRPAADLVPRGLLSAEAEALLAAACASWCFTGMGSWADNVFAGSSQGEHERLVAVHYDAVRDALLSSVTPDPGEGEPRDSETRKPA